MGIAEVGPERGMAGEGREMAVEGGGAQSERFVHSSSQRISLCGCLVARSGSVVGDAGDGGKV